MSHTHHHHHHPHGSCSGHTHDHAHSHGHSHGLGFGKPHTHAPASYGGAFAIGIILNTGYVGAEALWGLWAHSVSLLADAGHNLSDVLGLAAAWLANSLTHRAPSARFTYGLRRSTILAAFVNAIFLMLVTGGIIWETIPRLFAPPPINGSTVSWVALAGLFVNGFTALLFMKGASKDINIRGAFLHMLSDAIMAFSVMIAGLLILWTGYTIIDPIVSLIVSLSIILATWSLLRDSITLSLDGVPAGIIPSDVKKALLTLPGVTDLHHLHIWPTSTTQTALTVHLVSDSTAHTTLIQKANTLLQENFAITHATFQIEQSQHPCPHTETCDPTHT